MTTTLIISAIALVVIIIVGTLAIRYQDKQIEKIKSENRERKLRERTMIKDIFVRELIPSEKYKFGRTEMTLIKIAEKEVGRVVSISTAYSILTYDIGAKSIVDRSKKDRVWTILR